MITPFRLAQVAIVLGFSGMPTLMHAGDTSPGPSRQQWREHVIDTKRRVQEEAAQRRFERPRARVEPSPEDEARRRSEIVLGDDSLLPGDLVMTDKGMLRFKGRSNDEEISASDFEPVDGPVPKAKGK